MENFNWENNFEAVKSFNTFRDFIWQTYTPRQLKDEIEQEREDFISSRKQTEELSNAMATDIEEYCSKEDAVRICGGQSTQWIDVQNIQINTAILEAMKELYRDHEELFDKNPDKKILDLISWEPSKVWSNTDNNYSAYKSLEKFIRANCVGADIIYAHHYGNSGSPHIYEGRAEEVYNHFKRDINAYIKGKPELHDKSCAIHVNSYIGSVMDKIHADSEEEILTDPTRRLDETKNLEKSGGR